MFSPNFCNFIAAFSFYSGESCYTESQKNTHAGGLFPHVPIHPRPRPGTTSSRAILFDEKQNIAAVSQKEFTQFYPKEGWVEHNPMEIWSSQYAVMMEVIAQSNIRASDLAAIGITNQRETTILWDKATGMPIYNAIVWQCRRTAPIVDGLVAQDLTDHIKAATGLLPDAYFSATKIRWVLDQWEGAQARAEKGEILFGTVDSWLLWKLTGGAVHATDVTNASRTMLFDIHKLDWDDTLLKALTSPAPCCRKCVSFQRNLRLYRDTGA